MNRINNLTGIFHLAIIAMFLLSLNGCGYKKNPYYIDDTSMSDENVEFILKKPTNENNETVDKNNAI